MKTLTRPDTNVSIYLFDDEIPVLIGATQTQVGDPAQLYISDCDTSNIVLHENVTAPDDWAGHKYLYVNGAWEPNPDLPPAQP